MNFKKNEHPYFLSGLLIAEDEEWLTLPKREKEKTGQEILLKFLFPGEFIERDYRESGKPFFKYKNEEVSLSHCGNVFACQVSKNIPCGVDVQHYKEKIIRLVDKFLNKSELEFIDTVAEEDKIKTITAMWSCKEALYKMYGKGFIDYIELFTILPFKPVNGLIETLADIGNGPNSYFFQVEFTDEYVWVFHTVLSPLP